MIKTNRKKICVLIVFIASFSIFYIPVNAQWAVPSPEGKNDLEVDWFNILPELDDSQIQTIDKKIEEIGKKWWEVTKYYNQTADELDTSEQIASWIMNRNTIIDYLKYLVKFLSQLGLVVWTGFIMYAWYKYMVSVFNGWKLPKETIKNAIIWVIIVVFSYAIMKTLTSLVWIT